MLLVGHRGGSPDRSPLLIRATEREPDDQATDSEHRNETHSGNPTAPSLVPPRLLDQLRTPNHGPVWRLVSRVVSHGSRNLFDDLNELVAPIPMMPSKPHEFTGPLEHRIAIGCTSAHSDATPSSEFNEPFISQRSQCPEHGVVVDAQYRGEVACCWESFSRFCLSIPNRTPDLRCDLLMERRHICRINPRGQYGANDTSPIGPNCPGGSERAAVTRPLALPR